MYVWCFILFVCFIGRQKNPSEAAIPVKISEYSNILLYKDFFTSKPPLRCLQNSLLFGLFQAWWMVRSPWSDKKDSWRTGHNSVALLTAEGWREGDRICPALTKNFMALHPWRPSFPFDIHGLKGGRILLHKMCLLWWGGVKICRRALGLVQKSWAADFFGFLSTKSDC